MSSDNPPLTPRLLVLVCTYNERRNLPNLIEAIARSVPHADILVVDDGSPDGTGAWVDEEMRRRQQLRLIQRGGKLGLGTAIKAGLIFAIEQGYAHVLNLDADFSHDPTAIPSLYQTAVDNAADLVIGSRYVEGGGLKNCSWRRVFVSRAANLCARILVGWSIRDCSSAYRCYRTDFLRQIELETLQCSGYGFLEEILWAILKRHGKVIERPIVYTERELGESKISLREAVGTMKVLCSLAKKRL